MRTGKVAKLFGIDIKTVQRWTDEFGDFFTEQAKGIGKPQREYAPEDLIVLNTVLKLRSQRAEPEKIRAVLTSRDFDTSLPPEATDISGESAVMVYAQIKALEARHEQDQQQIEYLQNELERERTRGDTILREVGKWQALAELYEKLWKEERDDKDGR